ncbi:TetR/AcrR family transcriptional regulator [Amycolatopsis sp. H20-H5]|uniref:TetR/AcrR family transcriptional regulator n=1 Tax=Amycolatopsis sp. H20-H5 TaxID=3046309 RepID=UPI002DB6C1F0|nr:TetR/AcrR family transcriptional regulator [Amycolatopsis sp. H20-H5]MEC3975158.1 TetR/AcrR family transcriptional regulator [Amycolatopsis sp. H20-H5]
MPATQNARERARAELTGEIADEARRQLAEVGAQGLSLRSVARELGMVSSALYRYFPSKERLLTALIVDAYNDIGEAAENADPGHGEDPRTRWEAIWHGTRAWAKAHPHEYALIYGSPIPGYQAPEDTLVPAGRVAFALIATITAVELRESPPREMPPGLREQAETLVRTLGADVSAETAIRLIMAWTQLFGSISFELFGQYVGSVDPTGDYFGHVARHLADFVGLP